jgi:hypothetical protein
VKRICLLLLIPGLLYAQDAKDFVLRVRKTSTTVTPQYNIVVTQPTGATITPNGSVLVDSNATQAFAISANSGYTLDSLQVDGALSDSLASYTFTAIAANHTLRAYVHLTLPSIIYLVSADGDTLKSADSDYLILP